MANTYKMYKILDTDNVQDISEDFINYVFMGKQRGNEVFLDTCDGTLIYNIEDLQELDINMNTIKELFKSIGGRKYFKKWLMEYNFYIDLWENFQEFVQCEG